MFDSEIFIKREELIEIHEKLMMTKIMFSKVNISNESKQNWKTLDTAKCP